MIIRTKQIPVETKLPKRQCLSELSRCYQNLNLIDVELKQESITFAQARKKEKPIWDKIRYLKHLLNA